MVFSYPLTFAQSLFHGVCRHLHIVQRWCCSFWQFSKRLWLCHLVLFFAYTVLISTRWLFLDFESWRCWEMDGLNDIFENLFLWRLEDFDHSNCEYVQVTCICDIFRIAFSLLVLLIPTNQYFFAPPWCSSSLRSSVGSFVHLAGQFFHQLFSLWRL